MSVWKQDGSDIVKITGDSYTVNGVYIDSLRTGLDSRRLRSWLRVNTPLPEYTEEQVLGTAQTAKIEEIETLALVGVTEASPTVSDLASARTIAAIWDLIAATPADKLKYPELNFIVTLSQYADEKIVFIKQASLAQVEAYTPSVDPDWPVYEL